MVAYTVKPARAPVKPRVVSPETGDLLPVDEEIQSLLDRRQRGPVELLGERGAGKSTALAHLAAVIEACDEVVFLDEPDVVDIRSYATERLVVFTSRKHRNIAAQSFYLAAWTDDDVIEYLLGAHPDRCRGVMQRLADDDFRDHLSGAPFLWRTVLDEMAADLDLDIRQAILRAASRYLPTDELQQLAGQYSLSFLIGDPEYAERIFGKLRAFEIRLRTLRMLGFRAFRLLLATRRIVRTLHSGVRNCFPTVPLPEDLIWEIARVAREDPDTMLALQELTRRKGVKSLPMAASVLHAAGADWRPAGHRLLRDGRFSCAKWQGVDLARAKLARVDLSHANLEAAKLTKADLEQGDLRRAHLRKADIRDANLRCARLANANLGDVAGKRCDFRSADLTNTSLQGAILPNAVFESANLTGANFYGATMSGVDLRHARIEDAVFSSTDLADALLNGLPLKLAQLFDAGFERAVLRGCDLEFVELPNARFASADLNGAVLTGSVMPNGRFCSANLQNAGLADVEWEGADLRRADLRGCSFHMGSSRSGLVGSPYPGHGSRTGFYDDAFDEQHFKAPEEIRKANLRGADLRGASVYETDFYLVDLRGAKYDQNQARHFRSCDAILDSQ